MNLGIYCYRDDISQILSGFSLHTSDDVAIHYLGVSSLKVLFERFNDLSDNERDIYIKNIHERFSHLSIIKVGEFNILTGDVNNLDNLVIYNNENMEDLFNVVLDDFKNNKGDDTDV